MRKVAGELSHTNTTVQVQQKVQPVSQEGCEGSRCVAVTPVGGFHRGRECDGRGMLHMLQEVYQRHWLLSELANHQVFLHQGASELAC